VGLSRLAYRVRQFAGSLWSGLDERQRVGIDRLLTAEQRLLFRQMAPAYQWHGFVVYSKLAADGCDDLEVLRAGLLHDVGKGSVTLPYRVAVVLLDAWWPRLEAGAEAIVITASGCGMMVKEYGYLLRNDLRYAKKAARVSELARDLVEVLAREDLTAFVRSREQRIAFQSPCSLQHGQQLAGITEQLLRKLGFNLTVVNDSHLCCGSAGTYSILQPDIAKRLRERKLENLEAGSPALIATANIGCLAFISEKAAVPVKHWIELLEPISIAPI